MNKMPELLTREECETILSRHFKNEDFELLEYFVEPLSDHVEGLLGEHYIIKTKVVRYNDTLAINFFAKIPPFQFDFVMKYVRGLNAFEKEVLFYETFMKEFKRYYPAFDENIVPKFYFSRNNDIIIMENLQEKNFVVARMMDEVHIKIILKALAKLHSASLIYEEKKSEELGKTFLLIHKYEDMLSEAIFQENEEFYGHKLHKASREGILSTIDLMVGEEISKCELKNKFYEATERCFEIVKPSKVFRNVLSHGDLYQKNILFRYENDVPAECKLFDFQLMKYNPPAYDVLKIIYQSTTAIQRQHHFEDLLNYYYDNLSEELLLGHLDPIYILPRDQFLASVRYMLPQCKIETGYYHSFQKLKPEVFGLIMSNLKDFREFSFVDRTPWMLENYTLDSEFKMWMDEIINEIIDMLIQYGITKEDCYAILRAKLNTTGYELISYSAKTKEEKTGGLGQHLKLKVNIKLNNQQLTHYFFVKLVPNGTFTDFVITSGAFNNEKFMFEEVYAEMSLLGIGTINKCIAPCYYSRLNDILVFEDLDQYGFKLVDKHKPFNFEEMSVVIKCLAKLHACTLVLEENVSKINGKKFRVENQFINNLSEIDYVKIEGHLGYVALKCSMKALIQMVDIFTDSNSTIRDDTVKHMVTEFYKNTMFDQSSPSKKYRNVICHGDLWRYNIMMKFVSGEPVDCRIVDWQNVRICPPAHDIMSVIYLNTSRTFRENFTSEILNLYHTEVGHILKQYDYEIEDIIPLQEFLRSCEEYKVFATNCAATMFPIVMLPSKEMEKLLDNKALCDHVMFVDRIDYISDMCQKDKRYKNVLEQTVKDLRVLCENIVKTL